MDITNFRRKVKEQKLSFTLAMVYAVCKSANEMEAFRYCFLDGRTEYLVQLRDKLLSCAR